MQKAQAVITDRREQGLFSANSSPSAREGGESCLDVSERIRGCGVAEKPSWWGCCDGNPTEIQPPADGHPWKYRTAKSDRL